MFSGFAPARAIRSRCGLCVNQKLVTPSTVTWKASPSTLTCAGTLGLLALLIAM